MAEVLATMVVGPLVSMVKDKASSYLLDQYKVMEGMEEQHKLLKRKLPAVLDVIADAEEQAAKNREGAKAWLEELRTVAYKANDLLDEFKYEALRRKAKAEGHYKEFGMDVIKLFLSHNSFEFRYKMANKLCMILQEIDVLIAEMNTFRFKFKPQPAMSLKWRQTDPNTPDNFVKIAIESREKEKEEIIHALVDQRDNVGFKVLPIVGMGGMGKTTLAQLVYNDSIIQQHFQVRLWVCVSENFDVDFLAERIVEEANKATGCRAEGTTTLDKLQNAVSGKRYLLILDDIWNREAYKWEKLRSYLHHGGTGSSVVTTTRDEYVAQFMGTIKTHEIKGLDLKIIQEIIKIGAFGSQAQVPTEFNNLVGDVANRCKGSPLAATALGTALRTRSTVQEWKAILSRKTICDEENGVLQILKLSYNCLPAHMRQCFAFCAMFPKDHEIDVEVLIRLWMANSFVPEQKGVCIEVTGQQIFNELAQRSFFQEVKQVGSDKMHYWDEHRYCSRITCKIHDLMHDVAQDSMREECVAIYTKLSQSEDFPYTARHVFLSVAVPENILNPSPEKGSPAIQTLICERLTDDLRRSERSTIDDLQHLLPECRSVRALKTRLVSSPSFDAEHRHLFEEPEDRHLVTGEGSARQKRGVCFIRHIFGEKQQRRHTKPPATHLAQARCGAERRVPNRPSFIEPKYLQHLRYLDLSRSDMEALPEDITILYHLQTLNLYNCFKLKRLPMAMKYMAALRHLYTHGCGMLKCMPPDLGHLTSLQTLTCFVAGSSGSGCSNIGELEKLDLGGQLELRQLENVTGADAKAANLGDKRKLEELKLSWDSAIHYDNEAHKVAQHKKQHKKVLEGLKPHDGLKALRMEYYGGRAFPTWMLELHGMVELKLCECKNLEKLPALWELPVLQFLNLSDLKNLHCLFSGGAPSEFQKLESMVLENMPKFVRWWDKNEVQGGELIFPKVEYLRIECCESLTVLPKAFPALRKIKLRGLDMFKGWKAVEGEQATFPSLEELNIIKCTQLIDFPEAPKLSTLDLHDCSQQASLQAVSRYITSLSSLMVFNKSDCDSEEQNLRAVEVCDSEQQNLSHESPMEALKLNGCQVFFSHSSALCFGKLACLEICECNDLVSWPENLFRGMVSLRTLQIRSCNNLTGLTCAEQSASERRGGALLPCLESLDIYECESLVQVPNLRAPCLKMLSIGKSNRLRSMVFGQQEDCTRLVSGEGVAQPSSSLIVPVTTSADGHCCFFPCLESLSIHKCSGLSEIVNLPPSIKTLRICDGKNLVSLSGEFLSLEELMIACCKMLQSLPNGPYSSLRVLEIKYCDRLMSMEFGEQENCTRLVNGEGVAQPADTTSSSLIVAESTSVDDHCCFFPCLESLTIYGCSGFSKVANLPPSIKTLDIWNCRNLVSVSGEVLSLQKLSIEFCERLQSLPNGPYSSLRVLEIETCHDIKQLPGNLQECLDHPDEKELDSRHRRVINKTAEQGEFDSEPEESMCMPDREHEEQVEHDSKPESMSDGTSTAVVLKQSSSTGSNHCFFPCLESLQINECRSLTKVANLPSSMETLNISECRRLVSLSGEVPSLEELIISKCPCLESLPNGPHQAYSSLRVLEIKDCISIKQLPRSLQQRLDLLEKKVLDTHLLQGPAEPVPTGRIAALMSKLACFRSRGVRRLDQGSFVDSSSDSLSDSS